MKWYKIDPVALEASPYYHEIVKEYVDSIDTVIRYLKSQELKLNLDFHEEFRAELRDRVLALDYAKHLISKRMGEITPQTLTSEAPGV